MSIFLRQQLTIRTTLTPDEVLASLGKHVVPWKLFSVFGPARGYDTYEGRIRGGSFCFTRVIHYANPSLPVIIGTVEADGEGAIINIRMRLSILVTAFIYAMFLFLVIWGIGISIKVINKDGFSFGLLLVPALFVLFYQFFKDLFLYQSKMAIRFFRRLFESTGD